MPPKTTVKSRTLHDLSLVLDKTVKQAKTPEQVDAAWQTLYGPARDALSLLHWRALVAERQAEANGNTRDLF